MVSGTLLHRNSLRAHSVPAAVLVTGTKALNEQRNPRVAESTHPDSLIYILVYFAHVSVGQVHIFRSVCTCE